MSKVSITGQDIVEEVLKRGIAKSNAPKICDGTFIAQDRFILDPAQLKVALCTRRAGKSFGSGKYLFKECIENPGVKTLFLAKTRFSAQGILWDDVLKKLDKKFDTHCDFKVSELRVVFPNGSSIQLLGADASETERDKVLGQKFKLVVIDEAEAYQHVDLRKLIYVTLEPAMTDHEGTICMIGMPNDVLVGLFYETTTNEGIDDTKEYGRKVWSMHRWSTIDNPHMRDKFLRSIEKQKKSNPGVENTPSFRQSYKGEWAISDNKLLYNIGPQNIWDGVLPIYKGGNWHYVMGMDTGWTDATSFAVGAYHDYDTHLYVISSFKQSLMPFDDIVRKMKTYFQEFPIDYVTIDPASKHIVESLKSRTQLPIFSAEKIEKMATIKIMDSDIQAGRIKYGPDTEAVREEYAKLVKGDNGKENPNCKNDAADSCLYMWRYCYQFLSEKPPEEPKFGTPEYFKKEVEESMERAARSQAVENKFQDPFEFGRPPRDDFYNRPPDDYYYNK